MKPKEPVQGRNDLPTSEQSKNVITFSSFFTQNNTYLAFLWGLNGENSREYIITKIVVSSLSHQKYFYF